MNFSNQTGRTLALSTILTILIVTQTFPAHALLLQDRKPQFPARTAHVNDFAAVLDASTKQRIENTLGNLQQRAGIEFVIAIIKTAGDQDVNLCPVEPRSFDVEIECSRVIRKRSEFLGQKVRIPTGELCEPIVRYDICSLLRFS